jgi:serine/threonine protein kinase
VHRDIKGANILIDNNGIPKLADFGAARKLADVSLSTNGTSTNNPKSLQGTPLFMAPEVVLQSGYGRQSDIWSLGCTVIEMITGRPPWSRFKTQVSALFHIASTDQPPELPAWISVHAKEFILLCMRRDPQQRANAVALLQHPFVANVVIESRSPRAVTGTTTATKATANYLNLDPNAFSKQWNNNNISDNNSHNNNNNNNNGSLYQIQLQRSIVSPSVLNQESHSSYDNPNTKVRSTSSSPIESVSDLESKMPLLFIDNNQNHNSEIHSPSNIIINHNNNNNSGEEMEVEV